MSESTIKLNALLNDLISPGLQKIKGATGGLKSELMSMVPAVGLAFAVHKVIDFGKEIIKVREEYEKTRAIFSVALGSKLLGEVFMEQIEDLASKIPVKLEELELAFQNLTVKGFKPTMDEMTKMAEFSTSQGKSLEDWSNAIIMAHMGKYIGLKRFAIGVKDSGNILKFTFRGVTTEVKKNDQAISNYLIGLGNLKGVTGSLAEKNETLIGSFTRLSNSWTIFKENLGSSSGIISQMTNYLNDLLVAANKVSQIKIANETFGFNEEGQNISTNPIKGIPQAFNVIMNALPKGQAQNEFKTMIGVGTGGLIVPKVDTKVNDAAAASTKFMGVIKNINDKFGKTEEIWNTKTNKLDKTTYDQAYFKKQKDEAIKYVEDLAKKNGTNYSKEVMNFQSIWKEAIENKKANFFTPYGDNNPPPTGKMKTETGKELSNTSAIKQLTINITKMVGVETIETTNLTSNTSIVGDLLIKQLERAVLDSKNIVYDK